ncbi:DUF2815 family protein [Corynebacterium dentalis]|uniref:DUF2815 family protein n=1 Tax=Corynebacterium dentalis TaxID=2014528 RepID=UPI00289D2FE7|nr:DUF2815 family protein [Corynebacterium dentalis]
MSLSPRVVTVYGRLSYAHLNTPHAPNDQAEAKYSATLLIDKNDHEAISAVTAAIKAAVDDGVSRNTFTQPIDPTHTKYPPLRDGDAPNDSGEPRGQEFAGHAFIAAKNKKQPMVVNAQRQPVLDPDEVYSGCYVNMAVEFYAYSNSGNKGIGASLIGVQKVKDGDRLGGEPPKAEDVFSAIGNQPASSGGLGF